MFDTSLKPSLRSSAEFHLSVNGTAVPPSVSKVSVNVTKTVNKLSTALLVLQDGRASSGQFDLTDGSLFTPGNEIQISAGPVGDPEVIFKGIIIKQSLKIRADRASQLVVECRHKAVRCTLGRNSVCFHDMSDADVLTKIFEANSISAGELEIEDTGFTHKELVQYNSNDWDFIITRAEAVGKVVITGDDKISIRAPTVAGEPVLSLQYGNDLIELDIEMDSRHQFESVVSKTWNMADQATAECQARPPVSIEEHGDLDAATLAQALGGRPLALNHSGSLPSEERQAWADAQMMKSRLSKIRGRAKFGGYAKVKPGDVIEIKGLGKRFGGKAFVSGVRQDYDGASGWKTHAQFGHCPQNFAEETTISAPKAGGLLPGVTGLHTGAVTDNEDPDGEARVRVKLPYINEDDDGVWARIALADAGNNRGLFFRPEVGDEVLLGFLYDDPRQPVILGMLHSSAITSPLGPTNDNHQKGYTSREGIKWIFNDDKKSVEIETPAGNKITISDDGKGITLEDQNTNKIEMNNSGITIKAAQKLTLSAGTELAISGPQLTLSGDAAVEIKGGGSTKVESSGILEVKGSLVKIN